MKTTSLRVMGILLGLWSTVPTVRAEDYVTAVNNYVQQIQQDQQNLNDYVNSIQDGIDQVVQQRDALLDRGTDTQPATWSMAPQPKAPVMVPRPTVPMAAPVVVPQPKALVPAPWPSR